MSRVTHFEAALAEARQLEIQEVAEAERAAKENERKVKDFERAKRGEVVTLEQRLVDAEAMRGGPCEYNLRCDARAWLRGLVDEHGFPVDPRTVTSKDAIASAGFDIAATAVTLIEVFVQGLQGITLDYRSELVRRLDEVERGAWQLFSRRMREIACED